MFEVVFQQSFLVLCELTSIRSLHRCTKASTCANILLLSRTQPTGENLWWSLAVCRESYTRKL